MPKVDFETPITVQSALESFTLALALVMTASRDHAAFETPPERATLHAAHFLSSLLEDAHQDVEALITRMEQEW